MDEEPQRNAREIAARNQERTYVGGRCPHGHNGLRYTSNGNCIECTKVQQAERHARFKKLLRGESA